MSRLDDLRPDEAELDDMERLALHARTDPYWAAIYAQEKRSQARREAS